MEHLFNLAGTPAQEAIEGDGKALLVVRSGVPLHIVYLPDGGETFQAETLMVVPHG